MTGKPAVVLLSGGLDSTTVLAIARSQGYVAVRSQLPVRAATQRRTGRCTAGRRSAGRCFAMWWQTSTCGCSVGQR